MIDFIFTQVSMSYGELIIIGLGLSVMGIIWGLILNGGE